MRRYLEPWVHRDLRRKMVFVGGPRQTGKTTVARAVLRDFEYRPRARGRYFNWDADEDRTALRNQRWHDDDELLVLDELHKFRRWRGWLKGLYDTSHPRHRFLVTGSARLDLDRHGGDSLVGRYHYWRLHPVTLGELPEGMESTEGVRRLLTVGGFPEPFLDGDEREARRWRRERLDRVLRDDIRDLEPVRDIQGIRVLIDLLRERVGQLVVVSNLAADLQVSSRTVKHWLAILERMYVVFVVRAWRTGVARALAKPFKVYFFDNCDVPDSAHHGLGPRFENLVATHLLKRIHFLEDRDGFRYQLCYIRDKEKREVDFAVVREGVVEELLEAKWSSTEVSRALRYHAERLSPRRAVQVVATLEQPFSSGALQVLPVLSAGLETSAEYYS